MKKSEKVLLVLIGVAALVFLYFNFIAKGDSKSSAQALPADVTYNEADLDTAVNGAMALATSNALTPAEQRKIDMAETPWGVDPFFVPTGFVATVTDPEAQAKCMESFQYYGSSTVSGVTYAIINEYEYLETEELMLGADLSPSGFYLSKISPDKVVIGQKDEEGVIVDQCDIYLMEFE